MKRLQRERGAILSVRVGVRSLALLLVLGHGLELHAAPKKNDDPVRKQQLEHSKSLYDEGLTAMKRKAYDEAYEKFVEAYRYAPELHLFTYNIASAAEAAGNCDAARTYYGLFLDRVPQHPERRKVEKSFQKLRAQCPYDAEAQAQMSTADRERRAQERAEEDAARALRQMFAELQRSLAFYEKARERFPETKAFAQAARRKKWQTWRVRRLLASYGVEPTQTAPEPVELPAEVRDACRKAGAQEKRNLDAFASVLDRYDNRDIKRIMARYQRTTKMRDRPAFDACRA